MLDQGSQYRGRNRIISQRLNLVGLALSTNTVWSNLLLQFLSLLKGFYQAKRSPAWQKALTELVIMSFQACTDTTLVQIFSRLQHHLGLLTYISLIKIRNRSWIRNRVRRQIPIATVTAFLLQSRYLLVSLLLRSRTQHFSLSYWNQSLHPLLLEMG